MAAGPPWQRWALCHGISGTMVNPALDELNHIHRAVATSPAGPAAAGPMFGRIHKFSPTLFDLSVKPRTKQSAWNNKQGKANMCVWFWVCILSARVRQNVVMSVSRLVFTLAITVPVWPLSGAWCQSAWCAATEFEGSVCPVGWMLHQGLHHIATRIVASSKNLLLWGRQGSPAHFSHASHKCCQWTLVLYHEAHQELPEEHHASRSPQSSDDLAHLSR